MPRLPGVSVIHATPAEDLRSVLAGANDGDIIVLTDNTYTSSGADSDSSLTIRNNINIRAQNQGGATLDGTTRDGSVGNVLQISGCAVVLEGLHITNGHAATFSSLSGEGGGLRIEKADVTLILCEVHGNVAARGGGIYVHSGNVTLSTVKIYSNSADTGGGIHISSGTVVLYHCELTVNYASFIGGGGLYMDQEGVGVDPGDGISLMLTDSHVHSNHGYDGGGMLIRAGTIMLSSCEIFRNGATVVDGLAGACIATCRPHARWLQRLPESRKHNRSRRRPQLGSRRTLKRTCRYPCAAHQM
jgi:hypothetical protein